MSEFADDAIVVDRRAGIDDDPLPDHGSRADDRACADDGPFANRRRW